MKLCCLQVNDRIEEHDVSEVSQAQKGKALFSHVEAKPIRYMCI
jgi:hypothetical protein